MGRTLVHELVEVEVVVAEEGERGGLRQEAVVAVSVGAGEHIKVVGLRGVPFLYCFPAYQTEAILEGGEQDRDVIQNLVAWQGRAGWQTCMIRKLWAARRMEEYRFAVLS